MKLGVILVAVLLLLPAVWLWRRGVRRSRQRFLASYRLPKGVMERFRLKHPELSEVQEALVLGGLKQYFQICEAAGKRFVSMPSQVVDDLWHEFILFTRNYQHFCLRAFGRYLHHTPAEAMATPSLPSQGIRRAWKQACRLEGIDPKTPARLPLLFAIDAQLSIAEGFVYQLDCKGVHPAQGPVYCASHIGCGSGCGSGCGGSCGDSDGGCDAGDGGGCGSGCGGGD